MTIDKERYTLRMPTKYAKIIRAEAEAVGTSMSSVILRIFAKHYGFINDSDEASISAQGDLRHDQKLRKPL